MDEKNKIRRIVEKAKVNTERTTLTSISFDSKTRVLPHNDIRETVSSDDVFNEERNESLLYRFSFSIKDIFHNTNFNQTGEDSFIDIHSKDEEGPRGYFSEIVDSDEGNTPDGQRTTGYTKTVKEAIIKQNDWYGYISGETDNCSIIKFEPNNSRFEMINPKGETNWEFLLTYPYKEDSTYSFNSGSIPVPLSDGLAIVSVNDVVYDEEDMLELKTPINNGLTQNSRIRIYKTANNHWEYDVYRTGDVSGSNRNNVFVIRKDPKSPIEQTPIIAEGLRFKRLVGSQKSSYYVRKVRPISAITTSDYDLFREAFATTIYGDNTHQIVYNEEVDLSPYRDNKGIPVSELYLTIIKNRDHDFWEPIKSGVQTKVIEGSTCVKCDDVYVSSGDIPPDTIYIKSNGEVLYNTTKPIAGFQFNISYCGAKGDMTGAYGGAADAAGHTVSTNSSNAVVLGFSITGGIIPAGDGILTNIKFTANSNPVKQATSIIISDVSGTQLNITYAPITSCDPCCAGDTTISNVNYNIRGITKTKGVAMETNITSNDTDYCLDIVEYNKREIQEVVLADVFHRINTNNREDKGCEEGYFYLPHHFIKIRDFSNEIEYGDPKKVLGIPRWAEDFTNGNKMWRDMYTIGFIDSKGNGVDYPFLNGRHYIFTNIYLNLMRQDPFQIYNLNSNNCYVVGPFGILYDDKESDFYEC